MPTTIDSAGITFNDATTLTSAVLAANSVGATQIANGSVTASKLGTTEQKQIAKAWVNFDGTGTIGTNKTIRSSYNVSSVTKTGTGNYIVNFTAAFTNTNYSTVYGSTFDLSTGAGWLAFQDNRLGTKTQSQFYIATTDGAIYRDSQEINITAFSN
jgi:hypothetical protein